MLYSNKETNWRAKCAAICRQHRPARKPMILAHIATVQHIVRVLSARHAARTRSQHLPHGCAQQHQGGNEIYDNTVHTQPAWNSTCQPDSRVGGTSKHGHTHTQPACPTPKNTGGTPYHERQDRQMCLIHATNAMLGGRIINPDDVLSHTHNMDKALQRASHNRKSLRGWYTPGQGNFSLATLNHWLHTCQPAEQTFYLKHARQVTPGKTATDILNDTNIPPYTEAFQLHYTKKTGWLHYGHAVALIQQDHQWWWVDSEGPTVHVMTNDDWSTMEGDLYIIQNGPLPPDHHAIDLRTAQSYLKGDTPTDTDAHEIYILTEKVL
jgi:hypothetical protein